MRTRSLPLAFVMLAVSAGTNAKGQQSNEAGSFDKQQSGRLTTTSQIRRVVTGKDATGKSTVIFDGVPPNIMPRRGGGAYMPLWFTDSTPADNSGNIIKDILQNILSFLQNIF